MKLDELGRILSTNRQKDQELSPFTRAAICGAVAAGASQRVVAAAFGVTQPVVSQTLQRFSTTSSFESKARKGRPKAFTRRERRYIVQLAKRDPRLTYKQLLKVIGSKASSSTVRRALREQHYRKWRAAKRIPLTLEVAQARYAFACHWLKDMEELEQVRGLEVASFFGLY